MNISRSLRITTIYSHVLLFLNIAPIAPYAYHILLHPTWKNVEKDFIFHKYTQRLLNPGAKFKLSGETHLSKSVC